MRGTKPETNGSAKPSKVVIHNNTWPKKIQLFYENKHVILPYIRMRYEGLDMLFTLQNIYFVETIAYCCVYFW